MSNDQATECVDCGAGAVYAKGLCSRCYAREYRRARRQHPLPAGELARYGTPDGHGLYGVLDEDDDGLLCHECGGRYRGLGSHSSLAHGLTADAYRQAHGLPRGLGLVSSAVGQEMSARYVDRIGSPGWAAFTAARDPEAASRARAPEDMLPTAASRRAAGERASRLGASTRSSRVRVCLACGATWCPLPGGYGRRSCGDPECVTQLTARRARQQAAARPTLTEDEAGQLTALRGQRLVDAVQRHRDRGISQASMARALGISKAAMSRLANGHPPRSLA